MVTDKKKDQNDGCPDYLSKYLGEPVYPRAMTNKEAADILKDIVNRTIYPRGCGKSGMIRKRFEAYMKAIKALEETPDE